MQSSRPADKDHSRSAALRGLCQRVAHLAAGAVSQEAHRVESFTSAAGSDQHNLAGQVMTASERTQHRVCDCIGLCHSAHAHHATGEVARAWVHDQHASLPQDFQVGLSRGMIPHVHVHCRSHKHRRGSCQVHRGQEIVGNAMSKLGQNICRRRSHNQRLGPLRLANMLNPVLFAGCLSGATARFVPQAGDNPVPGERSKRERLHETTCGLGHHNVDFQGLSLQGTHQFRCLVRSDPARNAHRYPHGSIVDQ